MDRRWTPLAAFNHIVAGLLGKEPETGRSMPPNLRTTRPWPACTDMRLLLDVLDTRWIEIGSTAPCEGRGIALPFEGQMRTACRLMQGLLIGLSNLLPVYAPKKATKWSTSAGRILPRRRAKPDLGAELAAIPENPGLRRRVPRMA